MENKIAEQIIRDELGPNGGLEGKSVAELERENVRDPLTGAYNRRKYDTEIQKLDKKGQRYGLIMADIDYFRKFNKKYGRPAGDSVLIEVFRVFSDNLNIAIPEEKDIVVRWGGEEVAVILPEIQDLNIAKNVAERLRDAVESAGFKIGNKKVDLSISLGVGINEVGENGKVLEKRVDAALNQSKKGGRNMVTVSEYGK